jgi:Uma2 family endonuclease
MQTAIALPSSATQVPPRRAFTVAEVSRMLETGVLGPDERFELIGGDIAPISPQRRLHAILRGRIGAWLLARLPAGLEAHQELTIDLGGQLFEPDIALTAPQPLDARFTPIAEVGLAIEIADTSLARDRDVKAPAYAAAGLAELWIVDLTARATLRLRQPGPQGFAETAAIPFDQPLTPLCAPDLALTIAPLAN